VPPRKRLEQTGSLAAFGAPDLAQQDFGEVQGRGLVGGLGVEVAGAFEHDPQEVDFTAVEGEPEAEFAVVADFDVHAATVRQRAPRTVAA